MLPFILLVLLCAVLGLLFVLLRRLQKDGRTSEHWQSLCRKIDEVEKTSDEEEWRSFMSVLRFFDRLFGKHSGTIKHPRLADIAKEKRSRSAPRRFDDNDGGGRGVLV